MPFDHTLSTKYFDVFYDDADNNIIDRIIRLIDDSYEQVINTFALSYDVNRFKFILCPDVTVYKRETGKSDDEYEDWMVGNAEYKKRTLCILSPQVVHDRTFDDMLSVIKHEIIHIAFDQLEDGDEANILLAEGIAVALAEQIDLSMLSEDDYPDVRKMSDEDYFYDNQGYLYSGAYVLHLLKRYGNEVFKKLYADQASIDDYLYDGFELDAIRELIR